MFFFLLPVGVTRRGERRIVVAWVLLALLAYRLFLASINPSLRIELVNVLPLPLGVESLSLMFQSLITPPLPTASMGSWHALSALMGSAGIFVIALLVVPSLEAQIGSTRLLGLIAIGVVLSIGIAYMPGLRATGAFWLGHAVLLVLSGAAFRFCFDDDLIVSYVFWVLIYAGRSSSGNFEVPLPVLLIPVLLFVIFGQTGSWYSAEEGMGGGLKTGPIGVTAWSIAVLLLGWAATFLMQRAKLTPVGQRRPLEAVKG